MFLKKKKEVKKESTEKKYIFVILEEIYSWVFSLIIALVLFFIINTFIAFTALVNGDSMYPNLENNDRIIATRSYNIESLSYEDIIIFYSESFNEYLVKRVIGLPGDKIDIVDGNVYRNNVLLDESRYIHYETSGDLSQIVEENHLFVLGDNRPNSGDSRSSVVGQIDFSDVKGKAIFRFFPHPKKIY